MWSWPTAILDLIFPPVCIICGGNLEEKQNEKRLQWAGQGLCGDCASGILWLREPFCPICAKPIASSVIPSHPCGDCLMDPPPFESARALIAYREETFSMIHRMKYGARPSLARFFGEMLARAFQKELEDLALSGIIPIPLHSKRLRERGFNQASLMAKRAGRLLGFPVHEGWFVRSRWTEPQVGLSRAEREANVRGAFNVRYPDKIREGRWLLLDDVYTTGSTVKEASKALKKTGAEAVHVLTLARVL